MNKRVKNYRKGQSEASIVSSYNDIHKKIQELEIQKHLLLEKGMKSNNPQTLVEVSGLIGQLNNQQNKQKSLLFNPNLFNNAGGYRNKFSSVTYDTLRNMASTPVIKSIISTRIEQISNFSEAQDDPTKLGWSIRKKRQIFGKDKNQKEELTDQERREIQCLIYFIDNCGEKEGRMYENDNFSIFLRKYTKDSLEIDQGVFEVVNNRLLKPIEFFATDGATYRLAPSYKNIEVSKDQEEINGCYPYYVQLDEGQVYTDFYPWELNFGIRNFSTSIRNWGYGRSELEDMVKIVTWTLFADEYNGKFFSQGSSPKGILRVGGESFDEDKLEEFRLQWQHTVAGVENAWKVPVLPADQVDFVNMQISNADMQFYQWLEYLIKLSCSLYKIDPMEIGFNLNTSGNGSQVNYEGNQEYKIEYSQDRGLMPVMKHIASRLNEKIVSCMYGGKYEFYWTGLQDTTENADLDNDIKKFQEGIITWKELREKYNLSSKLDSDDWLGNQIWLQLQQSKQQMQMGGNPFSNNVVDGEISNPFQLNDNDNFSLDNYAVNNPFNSEEEHVSSLLQDTTNPFMKDFLSYIDDTLLLK